MIRSIRVAILVITITALTNCSQPQASNAETAPVPAHSHAEPQKPALEVVLDEKKDPVCGMPVAHLVKDTTLYAQKIYGFCSDECRKMFIDNPTAYVKPKN